ncbi:MAG TPA: diguanylate cyclase [archaeon]|nr:diguanylate cyclase [archaeon]
MAINENYYKNLLDKLYDGICSVDRHKKINYWNKTAEKITGYRAKELRGKKYGIDILLQSPGEEHSSTLSLIEQTLADGVPREGEYFIRHKEGQEIPVLIRTEPLNDSKGGISGAVQILRDNSSKIATRTMIDKLRELAMIDPLTGLANRRYIDKILDSKTNEMCRYGLNFGVLFIDIDFFKSVNDRYGHDLGDKVLWMVSRCMSNVIRSSDILGRWGGEEFVAVILNVNREQLYFVAEKLRSYIEQTDIKNNDMHVKVTVSIGATLADPEKMKDKKSILKKADELMYKSKIAGRNRVTIN